MIRVLVADDHALVRRGLRELLAETADIEVAAEAGTAAEALDRVRQQPLDVVVLDLSLPGRGGLDLLGEIKGERADLPVLILTMHPEEQYAVRALKAGAAGYLTKETAPEELVRAIRKVAGGGKYVTTALGEKLALELEDKRAGPLHETLSDREYQIMWLIASGKTGREIARELTLSPNTVSTYRNRILRKMKMKSNAELMRYAVKYQLVD